jgi:hypothetical protein
VFNNILNKILNFYYIKIKSVVRKTVPEEKKRKRVSVAINPEVYKLWKKYCIDNGIENYSEYIEKIIINKVSN